MSILQPHTRAALARWLPAAQLLVLVLWAAALLLGGAALMASHVAVLPRPAPADPRLAAALSRARPPGGGWLAVHVLDADCPCSREVLAHLLKRGPVAAATERIVMVGDDPPAAARARARGFPVEVLDPEELLARYHVEAAPLLLLRDGAGAVRYVGGYSARRRDGHLRDVEVLRDLQAGRQVAPLPSFGCAVSDKLRATVDPLRINYPARQARPQGRDPR